MDFFFFNPEMSGVQVSAPHICWCVPFLTKFYLICHWFSPINLKTQLDTDDHIWENAGKFHLGVVLFFFLFLKTIFKCTKNISFSSKQTDYRLTEK